MWHYHVFRHMCYPRFLEISCCYFLHYGASVTVESLRSKMMADIKIKYHVWRIYKSTYLCLILFLPIIKWVNSIINSSRHIFILQTSSFYMLAGHGTKGAHRFFSSWWFHWPFTTYYLSHYLLSTTPCQDYPKATEVNLTKYMLIVSRTS